MNKITPISKSAVTPELILDAIQKDVEDMQEIYCVAFSQSGEVYQYYSGDVKGIAWASLIMQEKALRTGDESD